MTSTSVLTLIAKSPSPRVEFEVVDGVVEGPALGNQGPTTRPALALEKRRDGIVAPPRL